MAHTVRDKRGSRPSDRVERGEIALRHSIQVSVLRTFTIAVEHVNVQLPPSARHLVAYLAVAGQSVVRRTISSQLWPDSQEHRGLARLRNLIWKVSGIVPDLITPGELDMRLRPHVRVDLDEARAVATQLLATNGNQPVSFTQGLLEDDLLPDWDDEWLMIERPAFTVLRLRALEAVARRRLEESRYYEAERACRSVIAAEPFRESARLLLAEVCMAQGNVGLALSELHGFADMLRSELRIAPNQEIQEMISTIYASG